MKLKQPSNVKVDVFNLVDDADKALYEDLLNQEKREQIKITRDEFTYDKMGTPKITVWYEIY